MPTVTTELGKNQTQMNHQTCWFTSEDVQIVQRHFSPPDCLGTFSGRTVTAGVMETLVPSLIVLDLL